MAMLAKTDPKKSKESQRAFLKMRTAWIEYVILDKSISHALARVGLFIACKTNPDDQYAWWFVRNLAVEMKVSTKTITDATLLFEKKGLMIVRRNKRLGNEYRIRLPLHLDTFS